MLDIVKSLAVNTTYISTASSGNGGDGDLMGTVTQIVNVALGLIGLVAVVMIILGGFSYTTSAGDAAKVKKAKDTIMYGVIGLVIALLAFAIVNFVLVAIFGSGTSTSTIGMIMFLH